MEQTKVLSSVKDVALVEKRRKQIVQAAIGLFKEKGFHRTTTREIAKQSGFSIGTLYEYIRTKEDVLFLVCDGIFEEVSKQLGAVMDIGKPSMENLVKIIRSYFYLIDEMQEEILILYQEVKSLSNESKKYILQKEIELVDMLKQIMIASLAYEIRDKDAELLANNIFVQGQMWGFRRWVLHEKFTLEEYIDIQVKYLLRGLSLETAVE